jgi:uncharacterized protein
MRIGVISDTHLPALGALPQAVFTVFDGVDLILHCGDITELSVLDELRALAPVEAVAGNMDGIEVQTKLPQKKVLTLGRFTAGLIHGKFKIDIQRDMIRKEFGAVDLIVYGHSHHAFWGKSGDVWFLNPGSPTDDRHAPYHTVALLEVGEELSAEIVRI